MNVRGFRIGDRVKGSVPPHGGSWVYYPESDELELFEAPTGAPSSNTNGSASKISSDRPNYEAIIAKWVKEGFAAYWFPTTQEWRSSFLNRLRKDRAWCKSMRNGNRGRPSDSHRDIVGSVIVDARNDPLRLLHNCGVPITSILAEIEYARYSYEQADKTDKVARSAKYRQALITQLQAARKSLAHAEVFAFQHIGAMEVKRELRRRKVEPPSIPSSNWIDLIIWILKNTSGSRRGEPAKEPDKKYLKKQLENQACGALDQATGTTHDAKVRSSIRSVVGKPIEAITAAVFQRRPRRRN